MSALPRAIPDAPYRGPSLEEFARDLARANGYDAADIQANANGFMSTRQFFRSVWQALRPLRNALWSACVWTALLLLVGSLFRASLMRFLFFHNYAIEAVAISLSLALSFVAALLNTTERTWRLIKDLLTGEVTWVDGRLDPTWGEELGEGFQRIKREMVPAYHYSVRQEKFEVQPQAYEMLKSKYDEFRPVVRLYFTPRSRLLLSIETLTVENGQTPAIRR